MGRFEKRKDFLGDEYTEHYDDAGNKTGESRERSDILGDTYSEDRDSSGRKTGESRKKPDILGGEYIEHTDTSGRKTGESREVNGLLGDRFIERRDAAGRVVDRTPLRAPPPAARGTSASSGDSTEALAGCLGKLVVVVFGIWLALTALAFAAILSPVWLGAVAVSVISGYLLAPKVLARLDEATLENIPTHEEPKGKKNRLRLSPPFVKDTVKFKPDLLLLLGGSLAYGLALSAWPLLTSGDLLFRVLLGAAVLAGVICGGLAGRRVLSWQLENLIFERTSIQDPTRLIAPKLAFVSSIVGVVLLSGIWLIALPTMNDPREYAGSAKTPHQASAVPDTPARTPSPTDQQPPNPPPRLPAPAGIAAPPSDPPASLPFDPATTRNAFPPGFRVAKESLSPDGRLGVLLPNHAHFVPGREGQNQVVHVERGRIVTPIVGESGFLDANVAMNHGGPAAIWSADGDYLAWVVAGKWGPRSLSLLKFDDAGGLLWQRDLLAKAGEGIRTFTRKAAFREYEIVKAQSSNAGTAFPDGFVIDVEQPNAGFRIPLKLRISLDANPKGIPELPSLRSSLDVTVTSDGELQFENLTVGNAGGDSSPRTDFPGERFPATRMKFLDQSDLNRMSLEDIQYAINEMFARHGATFAKDETQRQFARFSWYHPQPGKDFDALEANFTDVEHANLKLLGARRDLLRSSRGASGR